MSNFNQVLNLSDAAVYKSKESVKNRDLGEEHTVKNRKTRLASIKHFDRSYSWSD